MDTILNLMINHHALIEAMFASFRDEAKERFPRAGVSLSELRWEIKKHFFTEENAIFDYLPLKSMDVFKTINQLKEQHIAMLIELQNFSDNLARVTEEEVESFYKLLEAHREIEEKNLYPKLDKEIAAEQKKQIIVHINQIPITKR